MRILILGGDGYVGWPMACFLTEKGHDVGIVDCFLRRELVKQVNVESIIPVYDIYQKQSIFKKKYKKALWFKFCNIEREYNKLVDALNEFSPEIIIHLAEIPSAVYSIKNAYTSSFVAKNNIIGTLNLLNAMKRVCGKVHLITLGNVIDDSVDNFGYLTKIYTQRSIELACKMWKFRATTLKTGSIYGTILTDKQLKTRLDVDEFFGTVINRFCAQAVAKLAITPFGKGDRKIAVISLKNVIQAISVIIQNTEKKGVGYCEFNYVDEICDLLTLADRCCAVSKELGIDVKVRCVENPRIENELNWDGFVLNELEKFNYKSSGNMVDELRILIAELLANNKKIQQFSRRLVPEVHWDRRRERVRFL